MAVAVVIASIDSEARASEHGGVRETEQDFFFQLPEAKAPSSLDAGRIAGGIRYAPCTIWLVSISPGMKTAVYFSAVLVRMYVILGDKIRNMISKATQDWFSS